MRGWLPTAIAVLAAFFGFLVYIGQAHSQTPPQSCAPSKALDDQLEKQYGETITAGGVLDPGTYLYITSNPKSGSFTILIRRPDGMSCIMVGGKGFALADPVPQKGNKL